MTTRLQFRDALTAKLTGIEDSGYGDFEFGTTELNTYLDLAVLRLFPALYEKLSLTSQDLVPYGSQGFSYLTVTVPEDRIFMVEDADELSPIFNWSIRSGKIVELDDQFSTVNVHYYGSYVLPGDDTTDLDIPREFVPLVVLGGLLEALESRQDTGVRPDPSTGFHQVSLIDRLAARYAVALLDVGMSLPATVR